MKLPILPREMRDGQPRREREEAAAARRAGINPIGGPSMRADSRCTSLCKCSTWRAILLFEKCSAGRYGVTLERSTVLSPDNVQ